MLETRRSLPEIGTLRFIDITSRIKFHCLSDGWHANSSLADGGALNDLGWHTVDFLHTVLNGITSIHVDYAKAIITRPREDYDCEDTILVSLSIERGNTTIPCFLKIFPVWDQSSLTSWYFMVIKELSESTTIQSGSRNSHKRLPNQDAWILGTSEPLSSALSRNVASPPTMLSRASFALRIASQLPFWRKFTKRL